MIILKKVLYITLLSLAVTSSSFGNSHWNKSKACTVAFSRFVHSLDLSVLDRDYLLMHLGGVLGAHIDRVLDKLYKYDKYTALHSRDVAQISLEFGVLLGLEKEDLAVLTLAGLIHDLGKKKVPLEILNKPGRLTDDEFKIIREHASHLRNESQLGEKLNPLVGKIWNQALDVADLHHEKWDGSGYPLGLRENQIHFLARVLTLADVWSALRTDRPYRDGMEIQQALKIIDAGINEGHFDPRLGKQFSIFVKHGLVDSIVERRRGSRLEAHFHIYLGKTHYRTSRGLLNNILRLRFSVEEDLPKKLAKINDTSLHNWIAWWIKQEGINNRGMLFDLRDQVSAKSVEELIIGYRKNGDNSELSKIITELNKNTAFLDQIEEEGLRSPLKRDRLDQFTFWRRTYPYVKFLEELKQRLDGGKSAKHRNDGFNFDALVFNAQMQVDSLPTFLPRRLKQPALKTEAMSTGTIISKPTDMKNITPGKWIYLIDHEGTIVMSPFVPELLSPHPRTPEELFKTSNYVATHRALYLNLLTHRWGGRIVGHSHMIPIPIAPIIIAAGEIRIVNGRITRLNNKSGTYHGTAENLDSAFNHFKKMGFVMRDVFLEDVSQSPQKKITHQDDIQRAKFYYLARFDEKTRKFADQLEILYSLLSRHFLDENLEFDSKKWISACYGLCDRLGILHLNVIFTMIGNEGTEHTARNLYKKGKLGKEISAALSQSFEFLQLNY